MYTQVFCRLLNAHQFNCVHKNKRKNKKSELKFTVNKFKRKYNHLRLNKQYCKAHKNLSALIFCANIKFSAIYISAKIYLGAYIKLSKFKNLQPKN